MVKRMKQELKIAAWLSAIFAGVYFLPVGTPRFDKAVFEALELTKWYAREHVILCLLPAFWIAGAIAAFFSKESVMKHLGPDASKMTSYGVASVSGTILAVCSCTVLPLFSGIYRMGAGLGPATAFLYSGPAINALAIVLTAKILGWEIGLARALGAVGFSLIIGALMAWLFRHDGQEKTRNAAVLPTAEEARPLWQTAAFFGVMVGILIFANWGSDSGQGFFVAVHAVKWPITAGLALVLAVMLRVWNRLPLWRIVLVAGLTAGVGLAFPGHPSSAVLVATLGLAWLTAGLRLAAGGGGTLPDRPGLVGGRAAVGRSDLSVARGEATGGCRASCGRVRTPESAGRRRGRLLRPVACAGCVEGECAIQGTCGQL